MPPRARLFPSLLFAAACGFAGAQEDHKTDLQQDALLGPVKSVTTSRISEPSPEVEKRIPFSVPLICQFCEYNGDGNRIANGRIADGDFFGDRTVIRRNPDGMVERISTTKVGPLPPDTAPVPPLMRYELAGPFGIVDSTTMQDGNTLSHLTRAYDARGNVSEVRQFDNNGLVSHELYKWTEDGQRKELDIYVKGDILLSQLTWDPETDVNRYTCFDPSGSLLESWTTQSGKVLSFWEASDEPGPCNAHLMYEDGANGDFIYYHCQKGAECKVSHSYSTYVGAGKQNIRHTDFRDSAGKLMRAADYQYEFDSKGNWTHRKVWVTIAGDPAPILLAEDARTITYWGE
jgi:hypothetical protein